MKNRTKIRLFKKKLYSLLKKMFPSSKWLIIYKHWAYLTLYNFRFINRCQNYLSPISQT